MIKPHFFTAILISITFSNFAYADPPSNIQANDLVALFEKLSGKHPGIRKAHATGVCASGRFEPNPQSTLFSASPLLSQGSLPVIARFSVGGGIPQADERNPGTRGMGVQIMLPDGARHMFTGNNFPVFAGKDPETFFGFLSTLLPDENGQRDPQKTLDYIRANPSVQANAAWNKQAKTAYSYANTEFFGLHTFFYNNAGKAIKFRWQITPDLGVKTIDPQQAQQLPASFLSDRLAKQLADNEVSYTLRAVLGHEEDVINDPSVQWPEDRENVSLGRIVLQKSGDDSCTAINFDPNVLSQGFSASDDPVLRMRSAAYAISFGKRLSGQ